jgi:hypothetical protein
MSDMDIGYGTFMKFRQIIALVSLAVAIYGAWKALQRTHRELAFAARE